VKAQSTQKFPLPTSIPEPRYKLSLCPLGVADPVYRDILGESGWARLKPEIQRRFSVRPTVDQCVRYTGVMKQVELSFMGWLFAQACRLIGSPLVPWRGKNVPAN